METLSLPKWNPLRLTTTNFSNWTLMVIDLMTRKWVSSFNKYAWPFVKCSYRACRILLEMLPFALYTSPLSEKHQSQSQSHIASKRKHQNQSYTATDGKSLSLGVEPHDQIFVTVWQLRSCFCGAPSLTRGRVCLLYMLLALASTVFLGSESLGTCDHILLSQIWDFPFRRLLRLAGSRWRYSAPPPYGWTPPPHKLHFI
jgi:hypothetical protein